MEFGRPNSSEDDKKADLPSNTAIERPVFRPFIPEAILRGGLETPEDEDETDEKETKKSRGLRSLRSLLPVIRDVSKEPVAKKHRILESMPIQHELSAADINEVNASTPTFEAGYENMAGSGAVHVLHEVEPSDLDSEYQQRAPSGYEAPASGKAIALEAMIKKYTQAENHKTPETPISVRSKDDREGEYASPAIQDSDQWRVIKSDAEASMFNQVVAENEAEGREVPRPSAVESSASTTPLETVPASRMEVSSYGGAGLLALIGVEAGFRYLGDRKSRRIARNNGANLQKQINTANERQKDMSAAMSFSRNRSEQLDRRRDDFERRASKAFERQQKQVKQWNMERASPEQRPDIVQPVMSDSSRDQLRTAPLAEVSHRQNNEANEPRVKLVPETDKFVEFQARPKVVMEQVAIAAEQDVPLEHAYERRQEIKDDPSAGPQTGGGAGSTHHDGPISQPSFSLPNSTGYQNNPNLSTSHNVKPDPYNKAARNGAVAAGIIIFAILAYLLMR